VAKVPIARHDVSRSVPLTLGLKRCIGGLRLSFSTNEVLPQTVEHAGPRPRIEIAKT
jgi:hypothetical protein